MSNDIVESAIARATEQAYQDWAVEHPSLARVIDQIALSGRVIERLRDTSEYRQAIASYHESRNELNLFNELLELASPIVQQLLGV